jgi:2-methylcitrate dehydratase PrpD
MNNEATSVSFPKAEQKITHEVADFILRTTVRDLPAEVAEAGKKSILDGIGLALAGSVAKTGDLVRTHLQSLALAADGPATVIGTALRAPAR